MASKFSMKPRNDFFLLGFTSVFFAAGIYCLSMSDLQIAEVWTLAVCLTAFYIVCIRQIERFFLNISYEEGTLELRSPLGFIKYQLNQEEILGYEDKAYPYVTRGQIPFMPDIRIMKVLVTREGKRISFYEKAYANYGDLSTFFEANFKLLATRPFRRLRYNLILLTSLLVFAAGYLLLVFCLSNRHRH